MSRAAGESDVTAPATAEHKLSSKGTAMLAFHNDPAVKAKYLNRVLAHAAADEIIHGTYWERGKGCAVGCTIHSGDHKNYETELGVPIMLARLEDRLFEGMQNGDSKQFPARFLEAIQPGADLSRVGWLWLHWLLTEELAGRDDPRVAKEIKACADVLIPLTKGEPCDRNAAGLARRAALEARSKVWAAATYADADATYAATLIGLSAGQAVAGIGFTIQATSLEKLSGTYLVRWAWSA